MTDIINKQIGFLRQWLNEDRIKDPKKMVTNDELKHWLAPVLSHLTTLEKRAEAGEFAVGCLEEIARMVCTEVDCEASILGEANAANTAYRKTIDSLVGKDNESCL